jgi:hypothetical protein
MKIESTNNTKVLKHNLAAIGASKSGKTHLISTIPGKALVCNTDKGIITLKKFKIQFTKVSSWAEFVEFMKFGTDPAKMKKYGFDWLAFDSVSTIAE